MQGIFLSNVSRSCQYSIPWRNYFWESSVEQCLLREDSRIKFRYFFIMGMYSPVIPKLSRRNVALSWCNHLNLHELSSTVYFNRYQANWVATSEPLYNKIATIQQHCTTRQFATEIVRRPWEIDFELPARGCAIMTSKRRLRSTRFSIIDLKQKDSNYSCQYFIVFEQNIMMFIMIQFVLNTFGPEPI